MIQGGSGRKCLRRNLERGSGVGRTRDMARQTDAEIEETVGRFAELMAELDERDDNHEDESDLLVEIVFHQFMSLAGDVCGEGHEAKLRYLLETCRMDEDQVLDYINGKRVLRITY